jgi:hypothetical protein
MQDGADGAGLDPERRGQLARRRPGLVVGDQLLDLLGAELPGAAGAVTPDRRRLGRIEAGSFSRSPTRALTWSFVFE